jgi:hypothetical protein
MKTPQTLINGPHKQINEIILVLQTHLPKCHLLINKKKKLNIFDSLNRYEALTQNESTENVPTDVNSHTIEN